MKETMGALWGGLCVVHTQVDFFTAGEEDIVR